MNNGYGFWPLAIISIVIVSWIFYRYVAPKSWREWSRAGLVQAFIISLYAEMYGFPVTIYVLARFFGFDASKTRASGNLWSNLFGTEAAMVVAMIIGYAFVFLGLGLLAEGWREVYRARREGRLASDGLYGMMRHPQYTGIFLAFFGEGVVHWPTIFSVALFPVVVGAYVLLARKEEQQAIEQFGEEYLEYQRRVPMFFPRLGNWKRLFQAANGRHGTRQ
ncbi:MAG: isoprenylcysteine carboxylmethyltransferase family protein [Armatimonadetes bacterium]|nr:isoprenylcysteine carboxylmethyltransferase family protein [Armatimonadota bacterium]